MKSSILKKWSKYQEKAKHLSFLYPLLCFLERLRLKVIHKKFRFDSWHYDNGWHCRPYKHVAVDVANSIDIDTVVEVGCGLGDIISRIDAKHCFGYDLDASVIAAARQSSGRKVVFHIGSFDSIAIEKMDLLIMINWIHNMPPEKLAAVLNMALSRTKFLLLDHIHSRATGYKFSHNFQELLDNRARLLRTESCGYGESRDLLLYKVTGNECKIPD